MYFYISFLLAHLYDLVMYAKVFVILHLVFNWYRVLCDFFVILNLHVVIV